MVTWSSYDSDAGCTTGGATTSSPTMTDGRNHSSTATDAVPLAVRLYSASEGRIVIEAVESIVNPSFHCSITALMEQLEELDADGIMLYVRQQRLLTKAQAIFKRGRHLKETVRNLGVIDYAYHNKRLPCNRKGIGLRLRSRL